MIFSTIKQKKSPKDCPSCTTYFSGHKKPNVTVGPSTSAQGVQVCFFFKVLTALKWQKGQASKWDRIYERVNCSVCLPVSLTIFGVLSAKKCNNSCRYCNFFSVANGEEDCKKKLFSNRRIPSKTYFKYFKTLKHQLSRALNFKI